jgi:hypothetical protein
MSAPGEILPGARYVPRERRGGRAPQRVTPGAFTAAGLAVPADRREWNAYRLSGGKGWPWSAAIAAHTRRCGCEVMPGPFLCVDCDRAGGDDGLAELAALARSLGRVLDLSACAVVPTPGHGPHEPGTHLWWRADPSRPVRPGPLPGHPLIEIKTRCTAPNSPGYEVRSAPAGDLSMIPRWLSALAPAEVTGYAVLPSATHRGSASRRMEGLIECLLEAGPGDGRNARLFWCACRAGEMVRAGEVGKDVAGTALFLAAEANGHVAKHGAGHTRSTIASGFRSAMAA